MLAECKARCKSWFSRHFARFTRRGVLDSDVARNDSGRLADQPQVGSGFAKDPAHGTVIWWWTTKWIKPEERRFVALEVPSFQIDRVLVAVGIVDSRSNAQRLIKGGGVTWRRSESAMEWTKVKEFKQEIEPGWPVILRIGDGLWRSVLVEEKGHDGKPVSKPKQFNSIAEVMRPIEDQTIEFWSELWRE